MKTSLLFANKDYKGSLARSRRKVQTHCHLRGNLFCLGEERPPIKDTKSLADISAGLRGKHEKQSPDRTGPKGCPSRKLSSGLLHQRPCGGLSWRMAPSDATSPRAVLLPTGTVRRTTAKPGTAPAPETLRLPYRLGDIAEADPPRARCSYVDPTEAEGW